MSGKVVVLRTDELIPIEAAAQILAWIVYPTKKVTRERLADAIVLLAPREAARHDPQWRNEKVSIKAGALLIDAGSAEGIVKKAWPTLRTRILAGNMALPLIVKALAGPRVGAFWKPGDPAFDIIARASLAQRRAGPYLIRFAQEAAWREDHRKEPNGFQVDRVVAIVMKNKPSVDYCGYWQRSRAV
jgi:hypothetical protein